MGSFYAAASLYGVLAAIGGVALSFGLDWPLGPSVVVVAAAFLPLGWGARLARRIRTG